MIKRAASWLALALVVSLLLVSFLSSFGVIPDGTSAIRNDGPLDPRDPLTATSSTAGSPLLQSTTTSSSVTEPGDSGEEAALLGELLLDGIKVEPESHTDSYDRDDWKHWVTREGGCSTREMVLVDESRSDAVVEPSGCKVVSGEWFSLYDGEVTNDPRDLEIDHVVPLAEAHRSGGWRWDSDRKRDFANDLEIDESLRAVSAASNRAKGDKDPAKWQPSRDESWCEYAVDWIAVKALWELSADAAEVKALRNMLRRCREPVETAGR